MRPLFAIMMIWAVSGCGSSPPTRFYSLEPTVAEAPLQVGARARTQTSVKINAVHIPSVLDRRTIVRGESNYQLRLSSQNRWGGDFGEMMRRVLTQDLQARLPSGMVIAPDAPAPTNARGVVVDILSFAPKGASVFLDADWIVLQGSPAQPTLHRDLHLMEPFAGSAASQAAAMSKLVGRLADSIAQGLRGISPD